MWRVRITEEQPLLGAVDPEERFGRFPRDYTIKGMFFPRLVDRIQDVESVRPLLVRPPARLRYLPFNDYPQVDYSRIAHAAAISMWPDEPVPEAMRRMARNDFEAFARTRVGRVMLALTGEITAAVRRLPDMYNVSLRGGSVLMQPVHLKDGVRLEFQDFYGWLDCYPVGTLEGIVRHFGRVPTIDAEFLSYSHAVFEIRWR